MAKEGVQISDAVSVGIPSLSPQRRGLDGNQQDKAESQQTLYTGCIPPTIAPVLGRILNSRAPQGLTALDKIHDKHWSNGMLTLPNL